MSLLFRVTNHVPLWRLGEFGLHRGIFVYASTTLNNSGFVPRIVPLVSTMPDYLASDPAELQILVDRELYKEVPEGAFLEENRFMVQNAALAKGSRNWNHHLFYFVGENHQSRISRSANRDISCLVELSLDPRVFRIEENDGWLPLVNVPIPEHSGLNGKHKQLVGIRPNSRIPVVLGGKEFSLVENMGEGLLGLEI